MVCITVNRNHLHKNFLQSSEPDIKFYFINLKRQENFDNWLCKYLLVEERLLAMIGQCRFCKLRALSYMSCSTSFVGCRFKLVFVNIRWEWSVLSQLTCCFASVAEKSQSSRIYVWQTPSFIFSCSVMSVMTSSRLWSIFFQFSTIASPVKEAWQVEQFILNFNLS